MDDSGSRVVVITGGSREIGRSIAFRFAREKPRIVLLHFDAREDEADKTLEALTYMGVKAEAHRTDVSSFEAVEMLFKDVLIRLGRVDVLVNNAGISSDRLLMRMREEEWDRVLMVNLKGVFNCTKAVLRTMIKQRSGRIVNISSIVGQIGNPGQANYAASKAGIMGFTKSIAREAAPRGINVNAVAPGFIDTEMTAGLPEKVKETYIRGIPLGRFGKTEDVAEAVYWLCSDAASYITGQIVHLNGGMYM